MVREMVTDTVEIFIGTLLLFAILFTAARPVLVL
jgi:hypothetical protein